MGKNRKRVNKKNQRVYNTPRPRKHGSPIESTSNDQYKGVIQHSIEVLKLKIEQSMLRRLIAMMARNRDIMMHFINDYKDHLTFIDNKISEHTKASCAKMKLFMGESSSKYDIPDNFHMTSTDLKSGFVVLEEKQKDPEVTPLMVAVIMADINPDFPHDDIKLGSIIPYTEEGSIEVLNNTISLLRSEDVLSVILSQKASVIEDNRNEDLKLARKWMCVSATCPDRKHQINLEDI